VSMPIVVFFQIRIGVFLNFSCVVIVTVAINTYGAAFFNLHQFPDWAASYQKFNTNITTIENVTLVT
jgi:hypothetical protein